jgi:tRNA(Ile)-lysidine synthase
LAVPGPQLSAFLRSISEAHVEDSSNHSCRYRRNRLRRRLLPHLERLWPGLSTRIPRLVAMLDFENRYWEGQLENLAAVVDAQGCRFPLARLREAPPPLVGRALVAAIQQVAPGRRLPAARFFLRLPEWLSAPARALRTWLLVPGLVIQQEGDTLWVRSAPLETTPAFSLTLEKGTWSLPWGELTVGSGNPERFSRKFFQEQAKNGIFWIDRATLVPPLWARSRQPGDRIRLAGGFSKKLKDILIEAGVPRRKRSLCMVIGDAVGILACLIPGDPGKSRLAERALLADCGADAMEHGSEDNLKAGTAVVLTLVVRGEDGGRHAE